MDAVRGFAVCGILLMNIVVLGQPAGAYQDPTYVSTPPPADMAVWLFNYVFADGKMRALFTMLFGASTALIAERVAASGAIPEEVHFRRMFWLFVIGMMHAWLVWYGDILVQYAAAGAIGFFLWRLQPRMLWLFFLLMIGLQLFQYWGLHLEASRPFPPGAGDAAAAALRREIANYRGDYSQALAERAPMTLYFQRVLLPRYLPELLGFMAFGIALYRNGFLTGAWPGSAYRKTIALGYLVAAPLTLPLAWLLVTRDFPSNLGPLAEGASMLLRPFIAMAHAAAVIMLLKSGKLGWLTERLEAAGRMAFSNYVGTSLVTTTLFYGYGFGLFARLSRAELYWVVLGVWVLILLWSKPWLQRYRYGPLEWLWRSLAQGEWQPMRRGGASALPAGS